MKKSKHFFEKCKIDWWGGYYIPVRNRWSLRIKKKHLSDKQKELFEREFGEQIIYHDEFDDWIIKNIS